MHSRGSTGLRADDWLGSRPTLGLQQGCNVEAGVHDVHGRPDKIW
jgi:hypothetical protein